MDAFSLLNFFQARAQLSYNSVDHGPQLNLVFQKWPIYMYWPTKSSKYKTNTGLAQRSPQSTYRAAVCVLPTASRHPSSSCRTQSPLSASSPACLLSLRAATSRAPPRTGDKQRVAEMQAAAAFNRGAFTSRPFRRPARSLLYMYVPALNSVLMTS